MVFQSKRPDPRGVTRNVHKMLVDHLLAQQSRHMQQGHPQTLQNHTENRDNIAQVWARPRPNTVKINCDAAWATSSGKGGLEVITRNHGGEIVGGAQRMKASDTINYLEVMAVLEGVKIVVANGWKSVEIELDALSVINHIRGTDKLC